MNIEESGDDVACTNAYFLLLSLAHLQKFGGGVLSILYLYFRSYEWNFVVFGAIYIEIIYLRAK